LSAGLAGAVIAFCSSATPTSAHVSLSSTTPADQSTLRRAPAAVVLTLTEPALVMGTRVVVSGPSGQVQQGPPRLVDRTITQDLQAGAPAGTYTVAWRATSSDGHPVTGTFSFRTTLPGAGTQPSVQRPADAPVPVRPGVPGWLVVVLGAVAVAVGLKFVRGRDPREF
jgi:hypothetical protein